MRKTDKRLGLLHVASRPLLLSEYSLSWHWLFSPPSIKGCQLAFTLWPLISLCAEHAYKRLHDTQRQTFLHFLINSLETAYCPNSLRSVCLDCRACKTHRTVVWLYISRIQFSTCWLYLSCMRYDCLFILYNEISDLLQGEQIVLGNPSVCQKEKIHSSIQHIYVIFIQLCSWIVRFTV